MFAPTNNPNDTSDQTVTNTSFYQSFAVADFRADTRVQDTVTDKRVIQILASAIIDVNHELEGWRLIQEAAGVVALANIESNVINGITTKEHQYKTAVYARAKALIIEKFRDVDTTRIGDDRASEIENVHAGYMQEMRENIRAIQDKPRTHVELI